MESKFSEVNNIAQGLNKLNQQLFQDLKDKSYLIGHTFFMSDQEKITIDEFKAIWNRKIYPQLEEYFFDEPGKLSNYKIENFWEEVGENSSSNSFQPKRYSKELLSEHLNRISAEHKDLQLKLEEWGENIKNVKVFRGHNNKEDFLTGGRTWQYFLKDNKKVRYDLFKLSGSGQIIIPYHSLKKRPPFTNTQFID